MATSAEITLLAAKLAIIEAALKDIRTAFLAPSAVTHKINAAGESLIKTQEGWSVIPYQDPGGIWTQGWGHTRGVTITSPLITQAEGEVLFQSDIVIFEAMVDQHITVPLNENQYAALVSLCFNEGSAPLTMTLGTKINSGDYVGAAHEFDRWVYQHGVKLAGLVNRRAAEKALFLTAVA